MGYFDGSRMKLWKWAQDYTLADHFFMAAYGGSYLNHLWLVCACTPRYPDAPASMRAQLEDNGSLKKKPTSPNPSCKARRRCSTARSRPTATPSTPCSALPAERHPAGGGRQPGFRRPGALSAAAAEGENHRRHAQREGRVMGLVRRRLERRHRRRPARAGREAHGDLRPRGHFRFQPHHQPFNYFERFAPGTAERARHLKDYEDLLADIDKGTLPQVVFYKPTGRLNQHPSYTDLAQGDAHLDDLLHRLRSSRQWRRWR